MNELSLLGINLKYITFLNTALSLPKWLGGSPDTKQCLMLRFNFISNVLW